MTKLEKEPRVTSFAPQFLVDDLGRCAANGVRIIRPLTATAWGTKDFYVEDPDGYILCFGGRPAAD